MHNISSLNKNPLNSLLAEFSFWFAKWNFLCTICRKLIASAVWELFQHFEIKNERMSCSYTSSAVLINIKFTMSLELLAFFEANNVIYSMSFFSVLWRSEFRIHLRLCPPVLDTQTYQSNVEDNRKQFGWHIYRIFSFESTKTLQNNPVSHAEVCGQLALWNSEWKHIKMCSWSCARELFALLNLSRWMRNELLEAALPQ